MIHRRHITEAREAMSSLVARLLVVMMIVAPVSGYAEEDGGGGGGAGAGAAGILQGIAKAIEGAAPAVIAGIQAAADKKIAQINASANVQMTQIAADTSKYLADIQTNVALYQAKTAQNINLQNQEGQTQRLGMQLDELRLARQEQLQDSRERLRYEKYLNDERIKLAYQQEADNVKLARATQQASLVQQGLSSGFIDTNSGSRLKVSGVLASNGGGTIPTSVLRPSQAMTARPQPSFLAVKTKVTGTPMRGLRASAPKRDSMLARLMASIKQPGFTSMRAGKVLSRGKGMMRFASVGAPLRGLLEGHLAAGSSASLKHRIVDTAGSISAKLIASGARAATGYPQSDLATFHAAVQSPGRSPASEAGERHRGALSGSASVYSTDPASFGSSEVPSSIAGGGHHGHSANSH